VKFINEIPELIVDPAVSANGPAVYAAFLLYCSVQIVSTGSPTSTIKIQASNDKGNPQDNFVPTNWFDIPSATVTLSASGVAAIPKTDLSYNWIRISHTAGGTGTLAVNLFAVGA